MNTVLPNLSQNIAEGFIKSPLLSFISVIILIFFIGGLILVGIITADRKKNILINRLLNKYEKLLQLFKISSDENKILNKLSVYLIDIDKKYLLLTDPNVFNNALNILRTKENIDGIILHSLEKKLGFLNVSPDKIIKSTFDINNNSLVIIIYNNNKISGHVLKSEKYLRVKVYDENDFIRKNEKVSILTYNYTGVYVFQVRLSENKNGILYFKHSLKPKIYQRREFYRKNKKRYVCIYCKEKINKPVSAMIINLSGGGASIDNSSLKFRVGDEFKIIFPNVKDNKLVVNAEVVRLSKYNSVIHVKFNYLNPLYYDKVIEIVNS